MKHMKPMVIGTLLLLGISGAAAQSLGDYARAVRKDKAEPNSTSHHYDNDNLPTNQPLSVVGPPPAADANAAPEAGDAKSKSSEKKAPVNPAAADAERQKAADEWNKKIDAQQAKIDSLNHDLDLQQREYRLRVATQYDSEGNRIQNAGQWGKEDAQYRSDSEAKQKALDAARQELNDLQDQAHKSGVAEKDKDNNNNDNANNNDNDNANANAKDNNKEKE